MLLALLVHLILSNGLDNIDKTVGQGQWPRVTRSTGAKSMCTSFGEECIERIVSVKSMSKTFYETVPFSFNGSRKVLRMYKVVD